MYNVFKFWNYILFATGITLLSITSSLNYPWYSRLIAVVAIGIAARGLSEEGDDFNGK